MSKEEIEIEEKLPNPVAGLNYVTKRHKIYLNNSFQWVIVNKYTMRLFTLYADHKFIYKTYVKNQLS